MHVVEKRFDVGDETAHAPGYDEANAAGLVRRHDRPRRAPQRPLHAAAEYPSGKDAEIDCLTVQMAALQLMTDDPFFANYVQGLIDGADDPANQYWNQPNRHW